MELSTMRITARLAGLAVLIAAPALVAAQQPAAQTPAQAEQPKQERLICRRFQDSSSMARVRRQCYTRAQWDRMAQDQRTNSPTMTAMSGSQSGQ
jgi:hypothetical protein